jgi:hypothetical protein
MLEDIRNHDPHPTREERAYMDNSVAAVGRAVLIVAIALVVGVGSSQMLNPDRPTTVAASHR